MHDSTSSPAPAASARSSTTPTPDAPALGAGWAPEIDVLFDAATLAARVRQLGADITASGTGPLCVVAVLKGSFMFFADLVRHIDRPLTCEFIAISSYGDNQTSSGIVRITSDLQRSIEGQNVLIVEDIIDTGLSMRYLLENFATRRPRSVQVCTLLKKPGNARVAVPVDHIGFSIGNEFVVGYGLDMAGRLRNLPYVGIYRGPADP